MNQSPNKTRGAANLLCQRNPNRPDTLCLRVRSALKVNQVEFAKLLEADAKTVGKWEMGRQPLPVYQRELERLAKKHGVTLEVGEAQTPPPKILVVRKSWRGYGVTHRAIGDPPLTGEVEGICGDDTEESRQQLAQYALELTKELPKRGRGRPRKTEIAQQEVTP